MDIPFSLPKPPSGTDRVSWWSIIGDSYAVINTILGQARIGFKYLQGYIETPLPG